MNGVQLFVRELQKRDVRFVATLCGHGLNPFDKACDDAGLRLVDVRNEQAAGYMAEVTGRLTRSVGVCAVSSGVAHANAMTGVVNAHFDGAPMLLVTGSGSTETMGLGQFQDLDQVALSKPVCKYARVIDRPERIPQFINEAFASALSGRPGPVHLTLPLDVQTAEVNPDHIVRQLPSPGLESQSSFGDPEQISRVADLLAHAERPLLIAGSGVYYAEGEEALLEFAESQAVPVVVPIWDRGPIPRPVDPFVGVIGAATGGPRLLDDADLILMVGASCDYRVGYLQPPAIRPDAHIVRIHADPARISQGVGAHYYVLGSPKTVLQQLTEACVQKEIRPTATWLEEARSRQQAFRLEVLLKRPDSPEQLHALDIVEAVRSVLTEETILIVDGGNIGQWIHQTLCDRYPGHWLTCGASGVIGYGIPAAMAARLVYPERPIIVITGDGSVTFSIAELESAARQQLGFAVIVADDQAWGIALSGQMRELGQGITSELGPVRFDKVAEGFGARGLQVSTVGEIVPAIRKGLRFDRPTLIHVPVVRSNPVPP